jgi:hypothetical protein
VFDSGRGGGNSGDGGGVICNNATVNFGNSVGTFSNAA